MSGVWYRNLIFNHVVPKLGGNPLSGLSERRIRASCQALFRSGLSAYPILYVGLSSGLRQGELISLPWAAVDVCGRRVVGFRGK